MTGSLVVSREKVETLSDFAQANGDPRLLSVPNPLEASKMPARLELDDAKCKQVMTIVFALMCER